jgi:hypothetical protein
MEGGMIDATKLALGLIVGIVVWRLLDHFYGKDTDDNED